MQQKLSRTSHHTEANKWKQCVTSETNSLKIIFVYVGPLLAASEVAQSVVISDVTAVRFHSIESITSQELITLQESTPSDEINKERHRYADDVIEDTNVVSGVQVAFNSK